MDRDASNDLKDDLDRVTEASDTLQWLVDQAESVLPESEDRTVMRLHISLVASYLNEYGVHRARGSDRDEAIRATVKGELDVTQQMRQVRQAMN